MAGAGYKLFNTGDVLTAAQVNTYLMEQTVMVFADAAARTTALTGVVSEGMISYLKDTNAVEVYNGSAWVSSDDPNAIQNTIVDAKGDLISASANDVPARLAAGSNGDSLVVDSGTSTGLRWQPSQAAGRNAIINGGFDIWQRGTSFTTNYLYTADRWVAGADAGTFTASRSTDVPSTFTYSLSMAGTNTTSAQIYQVIESQNSAHMAGQTVTLSVYAKSTVGSAGLAWLTQIPGAADNWSSASTDQSGTFTASASGSWTRYSATFTVGANATRGYKIYIYRNVNTTSTTTLYTGIQLELGSVATTFTRAGGTLGGELAACQRYYILLANGTTQAIANGFYYSTTEIDGVIHLPVAMRQSPSIAQVTGTNYYGFLCNSATDTFNSLTVGRLQAGNTALSVYNSSEVSGTAGQAGFISTNNASSFLAFSAEL